MIPAALGLAASPLARYAAAAAVAGGLFAWAWMERAGRQIAALEAAAARREVASLQRQIQQMEARRVEEDAVAREPDPTRSLRDAWTRP